MENDIILKMQETTGSRIKERRNAIIPKMTQKDLATALGVSQSRVAQYEAGREMPRRSTLERIADALMCSEEYLMGMHDNPNQMPLRKIIGKRIEEQRTAIRPQLTQESLASAIGVQPYDIARFESGKETPDTKTIARIAHTLGCTEAYILGRVKKPNEIENYHHGNSSEAYGSALIEKCIKDLGYYPDNFLLEDESKMIIIDKAYEHYYTADRSKWADHIKNIRALIDGQTQYFLENCCEKTSREDYWEDYWENNRKKITPNAYDRDE